MLAREVIVCRPDDELSLAAQMMLWAKVRHLPVVRDREILGVISERDILRRQAEVGVRGFAREKVESAMHAPAVTATPDEPMAGALSRMLSHRLGCLPVQEHGEVVGIVTVTDLLENTLESSLRTPAAGLPRPVRSIMRTAPAVAAPSTLLFDAAALMARRGVRHLPVVRSDQTVAGILSDRDVRAAIGDPRRLTDDESAMARAMALLVGDVMSKSVVTVREDEPMTSATEHLVHEAFGALPVVNSEGKLVGIVSYLDFLNALR